MGHNLFPSILSLQILSIRNYKKQKTHQKTHFEINLQLIFANFPLVLPAPRQYPPQQPRCHDQRHRRSSNVLESVPRVAPDLQAIGRKSKNDSQPWSWIRRHHIHEPWPPTSSNHQHLWRSKGDINSCQNRDENLRGQPAHTTPPTMPTTVPPRNRSLFGAIM